MKELLLKRLRGVARFFKVNMRYVGTLMQVAGAYVAVYFVMSKGAGMWVYLIPGISYIIGSIIKSVVEVVGIGNKCPLPYKRFTLKSSDMGEDSVSVAREELADALMFLAEVEDYLVYEGRLKDLEHIGEDTAETKEI